MPILRSLYFSALSCETRPDNTRERERENLFSLAITLHACGQGVREKERKEERERERQREIRHTNHNAHKSNFYRRRKPCEDALTRTTLAVNEVEEEVYPPWWMTKCRQTSSSSESTNFLLPSLMPPTRHKHATQVIQRRPNTFVRQ